ncbi:hybrid sensor histidine kinase/response regulator [Desulfosudis oleivorans]|uniref:histidine kinase n=1 Tax=Desulfosudis oleivorans (strain DSM 6200 / JCM 39069 / Hxd3) TaxID=96561 RepID=A9A0P9_DESOH|nr:PAS domain-containing sensor histidine kinase [Desulfosudis oleivorans]ABW69066.1 PAS/PAC sensor hybrid histidine kinase [Desulfosudis oleivorans Hxd3]
MSFYRKEDEKLRMFMEHTSSLVAILDKNGNYEYVSPSHERLLGYSPKALLGTSGFGIVYPEDGEWMAKILADGLSGSMDRVYGLEYRALDKEGRVHYLKGNFDSIRDNRANLQNIVFVGDDVTDLRESAAELDREKEKFRGLMEGSPLGIFVREKDDAISYVNATFVALFGYTQKEIATGSDWFQLVYPSVEHRQQILETWKADLETVSPGGSSPTRKHVVTCRDGTEKTVLLFFVVLQTGEQLVVCQDITRQESLEAQFLHAQKMESIGRLASGIAHDFNNLLTTIIGNADFALMDLKPEDDLHDVVREIKDAADRAANLTRQLLAFSRRQSCHPEELSLNTKLQDTEKMIRRLIGENIELELALASDAARVEMDPGQLDQVIMNLVVNARDAMPDGGKLTIQTARVDLSGDDPVSPVELIPGAYVLLSMTDTGMGIPREVQDQVFEPFFTTKEKGKGTGLGLSTVYGIIKQNNGNTLIYSEPGKGTTVKIFLPVHERPSDNTGKPADRGTRLHGTEAILLTEDEERVRKIVARMLMRYGYTVMEAGDGREAQRLFRAAHQPVKLLLTDMIMPGMNGLELAVSLRGAQPDLKVLCMSGYTDTALFEGVKNEGFEFIHKPFTPTTLAAKVRELLDEEQG